MPSENPYAAPEPIRHSSKPIDGPLPRSAYISAGCSGVLVFLGAMFVGGALLFMFAPGLAEMAAVSFLILLFVSLLAAVVSSWETLQLARRRRLVVSSETDEAEEAQDAEIV